MKKTLCRAISLFLTFIILLFPSAISAQQTVQARFKDVPLNNWADKAIHDARDIGIVMGRPGNLFGYGDTVLRCEFLAFLIRIMDWQLITPAKGSFTDNLDRNKWYFSYVETALAHGVVSTDTPKFRPNDKITREEMAVMIVKALGYNSLAGQLSYLGKPFDDVTSSTGYINIVKDMGIVTGRTAATFVPKGVAMREDAVVMLMRMYYKLYQPVEELHAYYAIYSSPQKDYIKDLTSISFGWSRLDFDQASGQVYLNTTSQNNNEYSLPEGYNTPVEEAENYGVSTQLMVAVQSAYIPKGQNGSNISLAEYILTNTDIRSKVINDIVQQVKLTEKDGTKVSFDGVVIDFECMKGNILKQAFNAFLQELKTSLAANGKKLYVAVHPARKPGLAYYDAYDFRKIGELADKVILMAHDYNAKTLTQAEMNNGYTDTPLTPIDEIYYALRAITDKSTGVADASKIMLQLNFDSIQWKLKDGKVINKNGEGYRPGYDAIGQVLLKTSSELKYSYYSENPYVKFTSSEDGTDNILWYEDSRSVMAKIKLARMFGINGVSLWRLGTIPDYTEGSSRHYLDIWQQILNAMQK
jgi:spore germination protein YaaH